MAAMHPVLRKIKRQAAIGLLAVGVILPLMLGWLLVGPIRPWTDEIAGAAALIGFAALLWSFVLSGRFRAITDVVGMDRTMRWHQATGLAVSLLLLLGHPFLYTLPDGPAFMRPDDLTHAHVLGLGGASIVTGVLAWLLLGLLTLTAIGRDQLPFRYEAWRAGHGALAISVVLLGLHHALSAGRYSASPVVAGTWLLLADMAAATLLWVWLIRPIGLARRPWRIASLRPAALRTWELVLEPVGHDGLRFQAGQFAWLKLDRAPFARREHPFSIASPPSEAGRLRFLIKEAGDFTRSIGALPPGARAFVDGPHGHLVVDDRPEPGLAFLCGGVGVAPALAILCEEARRPNPRPMLLVYGNRLAGQILAREELERLCAASRLEVVHVIGEPSPDWIGETGQLDTAVIARHCEVAAREGWLFVLCGPPPMLREARRTLRALGVSRKRILEERFTYG
ncbi:ferredoxin reductase family protein [Falsiroseomonas tokyonensis]|uniref:Ferric reductase-like transmembrane domain-containing protein n=1 Tax=Falsiroseomonas tokyonensis TaxID=430521 RepID=A0ABV7C140_9PROT|nr:ferric reductase-like transmembrane domain-containing protein [Falsiroseomonas tokyonensis]MBU8541411.1 ferric reductase-like transmembrane domain-containing protein [Falsiroseomonas tokyonensis]